MIKRRSGRRINWVVLWLVGLFLGQCALLLVVATPNWDAAFYYAYARSTLFDGDLALQNDLQLSYATAGSDFVNRQLDTDLTATGRVNTPFAIGSSLFYLPVLATVRLLLGLASAVGLNLSGSTGYEWPYLATAAAFSAILGLLAFWVTWRAAKRLAGRRAALLAVTTLMFTTPLLYYQFREPLYAHTAAAFVTSLVVWRWLRTEGRVLQPAGALLFGGLIGLAALVRWQHALYLLLPLATAGWALAGRGTERRSVRVVLRYLLLVGMGAVVPMLLQMAQWKLFHGAWLLVPQGEGFINWRAAFLGQVLFSPFRGLLAWMPIFFPAALGLLFLARRHTRLVLPLLGVLLLDLLVNSSTPDWFAGGGYGPRRFLGELLILGVGYAGFLRLFRQRWRLIVGVVAGLLLAWHQWILLRYGLIERMGGRVLSMAPNFRWEEDSLVTFAGQIGRHLLDPLRDPVDFFVLPGSPLHLWLLGMGISWAHVVGLVLAGGLVLLGLWLTGRWWRAWRRNGRVRRYSLAGAALFCLLGAAWIVLLA